MVLPSKSTSRGDELQISFAEARRQPLSGHTHEPADCSTETIGAWVGTVGQELTYLARGWI
jgi:hypothetical protein